MLEFNAEKAKKLTESYKFIQYGDELQNILNQIREATSKGYSSTTISPIKSNSCFWIRQKLQSFGYSVSTTNSQLEVS